MSNLESVYWPSIQYDQRLLHFVPHVVDCMSGWRNTTVVSAASSEICKRREPDPVMRERFFFTHGAGRALRAPAPTNLGSGTFERAVCALEPRYRIRACDRGPRCAENIRIEPTANAPALLDQAISRAAMRSKLAS